MKLKLFSFLQRPDRARIPETKPIARTGDARYVPRIATWGQGRSGKIICQANRFDDISIRDYDRVRFYPVIRDGLRMLRLATRRTNFHFTCSRQDIADLAQKELGPKIPFLIETLMRGSLEFGWQAVAKRWRPSFEQTVTSGQGSAGSSLERHFPFIWTIDRFHSFSPQDTRLLINTVNGDFAGVRQYMALGSNPDVLAKDCIHFINDREYDGNYGVPLSKAAVPFVEAAESVLDDMSLYCNIFGSPWKIGRYPPGRVGAGVDEDGNPEFASNADAMAGILEDIESAHNVALPSNTDDKGNRRWDIEIQTVPAEDRYVPKLEFLNNMIRMAIAFPEMASSSAPDSGTYNLGQTQIDLFLANIQSYLDSLSETINQQLVKDFVNFNFGPSAPDCILVMEPVDFSAKKALLEALVSFLSTGQPLQEMGGKYIYPDWAKMAEDMGVPVLTADPRLAAQNLLQAARERLAQMNGARADLEPKPEPVEDAKPKLAEWEEGKHPRDQAGKFASKDEVGAFVDDAISDVLNDHKKLTIATVDEGKASRIKELTGINVQGFVHEVDNYGVRHALDSHGDSAAEKLRGQIAITAEDLKAIPSILEAPDSIESGGKTPQGTESIVYSKQVGEHMVYVEEILTRAKSLRMRTMYKRPATPRAKT